MIIAVIGSWLQTNPRQSVMQIMLSCHEWLLAPIRRLIPSFGGLDFSPIAALFLLNLIRRLLAHLIQIL
ncbi:YggT family protein [Rappaport israeli]|uniref:YggT family protein n=1 Tax=Rappaport israeli TaxID=1839807 RepID=UPI000ABE6876|nr:YggT family protein [Rappaport israeli]